MKLRYLGLIVLTLLSMQNVIAQMVGVTTQVATNGSATIYSNTPFVTDSASYVNGGVTFTYPVGTFTTVPTVQVSVELLGATYATNQVYTAMVTANSASSTTVMVNFDNNGPITEAATGDVTVYIRANGN